MNQLEQDLNRLAAVDLSAVFDLTLIEQAAWGQLALQTLDSPVHDRIADRLAELIDTFGGTTPPHQFLKGFAAGMVSYGLSNE